MCEQLKGTQMGAQTSKVIAEAAKQHMDKAGLEEYRPKMWLRYVDDTFYLNARNGVASLVCVA